MTRASPDRGLAAERTTLAWTRTSFAFLGNGALLAIRNLRGGEDVVDLIPAALAAAAAACSFVIAMRRQYMLQRRPVRQVTPRREVYLIGIALLLLIFTTAVAQLL